MADQYDKPRSEPHGNGFSGRNNEVDKQMNSEIHKLRQEDGEGGIPEEAGNDFTFADEAPIGRKTGDDLPGETASNRE